MSKVQEMNGADSADSADGDNEEQISILHIGLGKIGLSLAVSLAQRFKVIGVDTDPTKILQLREGISPYPEPGLQNALTDAVDAGTFHVAQRLDGLVEVPSIIVVHVDTTVSPNGDIDHTNIVHTLQEVGSVISQSHARHTIVISSTVIPGFCDRAAKKYLEETSGKVLNDAFNVAYVPNNVRLGHCMGDFAYPAYLVIGASNDHAMKQALTVYDTGRCPIVRTSLVNAELYKLTLSGYLIVKATFANELANLCESLIGAEVDTITNILSLDSRIGEGFLTAGATLGGFRLPQEVSTLRAVAGFARTKFPLVDTAYTSNGNITGRIFNLITTELLTAKNRRVAVLGLSYRSGISYKAGSLGYAIAQNLRGLGVNVRTYDPLTADENSVKNAKTAVDGAGVVLVANSEPEFREVEFGKDQLVIDVWRCLDGDAVQEQGARYLALGMGRKA